MNENNASYSILSVVISELDNILPKSFSIDFIRESECGIFERYPTIILTALKDAIFKGFLIDGAASVLQGDEFLATSIRESSSYFIREITGEYDYFIVGGILGGILSGLIQSYTAGPEQSKIGITSSAIYNTIGYELIKKYGFEEDQWHELGLINLLELSTSLFQWSIGGFFRVSEENRNLLNYVCEGIKNGISIGASNMLIYGSIMSIMPGDDKKLDEFTLDVNFSPIVNISEQCPADKGTDAFINPELIAGF